MAQMVTRHCGPLEYDESAVIEFPLGLPGFETHRRFVPIEPASMAPIVFLQSLDAPEVCFLAAPINTIDAAYELAAAPEDLRQIGLNERAQPRIGDEVLCLAILSAPENGPLTANLLAPVIIALRTRRAVQAVRSDSRYSHLHPLSGAEIPCS
jgi:flagellar assembly factor FliW